MQLSLRTLSGALGLLAFIAAGLSYWAGEQVGMATKESGVARDATFKSYRIAQSLKSITAGYELTMNEFYSTVLTFPAYQKKVMEHKAALDQNLAALSSMQEGAAATATELTKIYSEMNNFRMSLEAAMTSTEKDWDRAREALFKMNVLSTRAIHQADLLGQSASERATTLDMHWQAYQAQALLYLRIAAALSLVLGVALVFGVLSGSRQAEAGAEE